MTSNHYVESSSHFARASKALAYCRLQASCCFLCFSDIQFIHS